MVKSVKYLIAQSLQGFFLSSKDFNTELHGGEHKSYFQMNFSNGGTMS